MELNKPKFNFFKNTYYAVSGLKEVFRNESSFRIEVIIFLILQTALIFAPLPLLSKAVLSVSMFLPIFAELANSAIERTVDMVTMEYSPKAKAAKDAGSAMVFVSFCMTGLIWFWTFLFTFFV